MGLNTMCASMFKQLADTIEGGAMAPHDVASKLLKDHWKVIFNGNGYDEEMQKMLTDSDVWRIDSGVEAICRFTDPKNIDLFSSMGVLSPEECASRQSVLLDHYVGTVEIEAKCMIQLLNQHVIPAVRKADHCNSPPIQSLQDAVNTIKHTMEAIHGEDDEKRRASLARTLRLDTMVQIRSVVDACEAVVPADLWTLATYQDLLFLDHTAE